MKIYLDYYGNITKVTDNVFVANASGYDNIIAFYFVDESGQVITRSDINYCSISVKRSDGFVISRLNASYVLTAEGRHWQYTIRENDGILYKRGQLEISAQFVKATIDDSGDTPVITKRETLAVESITAHVKQNIGLAEEDTFNETLEQAMLDRDTLQAEITENAQAIDANAQAIEQLAENKPDTVITNVLSVNVEPVVNADVVISATNFENGNAGIGDDFWAIAKYANSFYAVQCRVESKSGANYNCYYKKVENIGNPTYFARKIEELLSGVASNTQAIRTIAWNESGNAFSITYSKGTGATGTVNVPLTALKNSINALDGRLDTAESDIDTLQNDMEELQNDVFNVQTMIPAEATINNKLADKNFVNSTVATQTANFRGTFPESEFPTDWQTTNPQGTHYVTNNDYVFKIKTQSGNTFYDRYKASVSGTSVSWQFEYELNNSSFTASQWTTINSGLTSADKLPEKVNDRYLHTNASTGALEWAEVQGGGGGTGDYDDLEHIPVVNADLETIVPVENTYYRHAGTGGGGAVATPFVEGQTYTQIYFDTSKTPEQMIPILAELVQDEYQVLETDPSNPDDYSDLYLFDLTYLLGIEGQGEDHVYAIASYELYNLYFVSEDCDLSALGKGVVTAGWHELDTEGKITFSEFEVDDADNVSFVSASPFESQFIDGVIYLYRDGEYQPLYGGRPMRWGTIQGTVTDQQDLVEYLNDNYTKTVIINSARTTIIDYDSLPELTAQQIIDAATAFRSGANVIINRGDTYNFKVLDANIGAPYIYQIHIICTGMGSQRKLVEYTNTNGTVSVTWNTLETASIVQEIGDIETALQTIRGTAE